MKHGYFAPRFCFAARSEAAGKPLCWIQKRPLHLRFGMYTEARPIRP